MIALFSARMTSHSLLRSLNCYVMLGTYHDDFRGSRLGVVVILKRAVIHWAAAVITSV
jgi:hypothetical protein